MEWEKGRLKSILNFKHDMLRGAITKKKRENSGKIPKGGGGVKKTDENSQFQFGNLKNLGGLGSQFFKNV